MPESPRRIKRSTTDRSQTFEERTDKSSREFYQSYKWQKFRGKNKQSQRKADEKLVHELYEQMQNTTFSSYARWLQGTDPLCVDCVDEGYIRPATVADHDKRIRAGGSAFDPKNIKWRCQHHHNKKSGKEAHE